MVSKSYLIMHSELARKEFLVRILNLSGIVSYVCCSYLLKSSRIYPTLKIFCGFLLWYN